MDSLTYDECMAKFSRAQLDDLKGGLSLLDKSYRQLMCTRMVQERGTNTDFVAKRLQANTQAAFDEIKAAEIDATSSFTFSDSRSDQALYTATGYQPSEKLTGYRDTSTGQRFTSN